MKNMITISLLASILFTTNLMAQTVSTDPENEVGIQFSGLDDLDFIYKKHRKENKYMRVRLVSFNLGVPIPGISVPVVTSNIGVTIGREKRKPLNDQLTFYKGWELMARLNGASYDQNGSPNNIDFGNTFILSPGFGFVFGMQYNIKENFLVNIETVPAISTGMVYEDGRLDINNLNFGFNSNAIALGVLYRF